MKYLFFLIPLLLLIPLEVDGIRSSTSETIFNANGSRTITIGLDPFIYNDATTSYQPFIQFEDSNLIQIETEHGSVQLDKNNCEFVFYDNGLINSTPLWTDSILAKVANVGTENWNYISSVNSQTCIASWDGSELIISKLNTGVGLLEYKYVNVNGDWKTQLEATNLSTFTDKKFGFEQIIDLNRDTINFGGSLKNLDVFDGTTFDRTFLENNKGKVIDFLNGFNLDFDLAFDNLNSVTVTDTGPNSSRLVFDYIYNAQVILPNDTLILDPIFDSIDFITVARILDNSGNAVTTCDATGLTKDTTTELFRRISTSSTNPVCAVYAAKFSLSEIPVTAQITNGVFNFEAVTIVGGGPNCRFNPMGVDIDIASNLAIWLDVLDGTPYVSSISCTPTSNYSIDLGTTFDQDVEDNLGETGTITVGVSITPMTRDGTTRIYTHIDQSLQITYDMPPDIVKNFNATLNTAFPYAVDLEWGVGDANGGGGPTYQIQRWSGTSWTQLASQDGLTYSDTNPIDNGTAMYRVLTTDTIGQNSGTFALNGTLGDNKISHWSFDYVTTDAGLVNNAGTVVGTERYIDGTIDANFPIIGFEFPDPQVVTQYITIPTEEDYDFEHTNPFSIAVWAKATSGVSEEDVIWTKDFSSTSTADNGYSLSYRKSTESVAVQFHSSGTEYIVVSTNLSYPEDSYSHIIFTYDGTSNQDGMKIYINGTLDATGGTSTITGSMLNGVPLRVGATSQSIRNWNGEINELIVFNTELTAHDVTNLFNSATTSSARIDTNFAPGNVTDLGTSNITFSAVDLNWSTPPLYGGSVLGYQINFTTPFGDPLTELVNNTDSTTTDFTVSNLAFATEHSFRVAPLSTLGNNTQSNVANAITGGQTFVVGSLIINQTNPVLLDIRFDRTDVNDTSTRVDVVYTNTYNLTCTVDHKFSRASTNYSNLDVVAVDSSRSSSSFFFNNHTNDIIDMYCYDENDTTRDARFQVVWSSFPLLDQFASFRSGDYGTDGVIGSIDFITLAVVIFSMIGLNRVNEAVGIIFNIALLGALAYFEIIELPTIIFGALAVVLIFGIASTRKR